MPGWPTRLSIQKHSGGSQREYGSEPTTPLRAEAFVPEDLKEERPRDGVEGLCSVKLELARSCLGWSEFMKVV